MSDIHQGSGHPLVGFVLAGISVASGGFAAISPNVEFIVRLGAGGIAILSGLMAIRYYHYATKEKIQALRNSKNQS